jgi:hypothetical protein
VVGWPTYIRVRLVSDFRFGVFMFLVIMESHLGSSNGRKQMHSASLVLPLRGWMLRSFLRVRSSGHPGVRSFSTTANISALISSSISLFPCCWLKGRRVPFIPIFLIGPLFPRDILPASHLSSRLRHGLRILYVTYPIQCTFSCTSRLTSNKLGWVEIVSPLPLMFAYGRGEDGDA